MKKILCALIAALIFMVWSCERITDKLSLDEDQSLVELNDGDNVPGQYIVLLKEGTTSIKKAKLSYSDAQILMRSEMQKVLALSDIAEKEPLRVYTEALEGFAIRLSEEEAKVLENNPGVFGVWSDKVVVVGKPTKPPVEPPDEVIPAGITRVGGGGEYNGSRKVWIIDTGVDLDNPDLNVKEESGATFVLRTSSANDDNGHGTHVAGIIAAIDNSIGVVGVAPGATVIPVKVLNRRGSGWMSDIIAGVDHVAANGIVGDVVNISLGGGLYDPLDKAVEAMGTKGLLVALAAGNESDDANNYSPARAEGKNIYTVSACDKNDYWASHRTCNCWKGELYSAFDSC